MFRGMIPASLRIAYDEPDRLVLRENGSLYLLIAAGSGGFGAALLVLSSRLLGTPSVNAWQVGLVICVGVVFVLGGVLTACYRKTVVVEREYQLIEIHERKRIRWVHKKLPFQAIRRVRLPYGPFVSSRGPSIYGWALFVDVSAATEPLLIEASSNTAYMHRIADGFEHLIACPVQRDTLEGVEAARQAAVGGLQQRQRIQAIRVLLLVSTFTGVAITTGILSIAGAAPGFTLAACLLVLLFGGGTLWCTFIWQK